MENQTSDYNPVVLHLRVVTHCTGIYRNIVVCHFQITGSRQRVITRYKSLSGKRFDYKVMWDFPRLADDDPPDSISFQVARPVVLGSSCSSKAISRREDDVDVNAPSHTRSAARALWAVVPPAY